MLWSHTRKCMCHFVCALGATRSAMKHCEKGKKNTVHGTRRRGHSQLWLSCQQLLRNEIRPEAPLWENALPWYYREEWRRRWWGGGWHVSRVVWHQRHTQCRDDNTWLSRILEDLPRSSATLHIPFWPISFTPVALYCELVVVVLYRWRRARWVRERSHPHLSIHHRVGHRPRDSGACLR
jgi:hypothetical protein